MRNTFTRNIAVFVKEEYRQANKARSISDVKTEFQHLENAHILGQKSTYWHSKTHYLMLLWSIRNGDFRECAGQLFRLLGALIMTPWGLCWINTISAGNTGGARISPFKPLPIKAEFQDIINNAKRKE